MKHPTSAFLNSAIYFHYDFATKSVTVMIFGTYLVEIERRLLQLFPSGQTVSMPGKDDPFAVLSAIVAEYSSMMEYERRKLDFSVRDQESKTGTTAHGTFFLRDVSISFFAGSFSTLVPTL